MVFAPPDDSRLFKAAAYIVAKDNLGELLALIAVSSDRLRPDGRGEHRGRRRGDHIGVSTWHINRVELTLAFVR